MRGGERETETGRQTERDRVGEIKSKLRERERRYVLKLSFLLKNGASFPPPSISLFVSETQILFDCFISPKSFVFSAFDISSCRVADKQSFYLVLIFLLPYLPNQVFINSCTFFLLAILLITNQFFFV